MTSDVAFAANGAGADPGRLRFQSALDSALRDALARRDIGSVHCSPYYLQWTARIDGVLVAEAVSNRYLDWAHQLRPAQQRALLRMGWQAREDAPNYQVWHENLNDLRPLTGLLTSTWCDVFRLAPDSAR